MTLVLPFGCDQITSSSLFSGNSSQNSSMPCVFDSEAFDRDLESALMKDWTSDITDYDMPSADSSLKAPSDSNDLKRKSTDDDFDQQSLSKKLRLDNADPVPPIQSEIVSSSSSSDLSSPNSSPVSSPSYSASSLESGTSSASCSSSSSSSSSSEGGQDDEISVEEEEYLPRRRGPQMWNSRQRWKDERKKVLKMSINKLADIEDPELCLLRSVLINNTIKKLHLDIRNERQAKLRHRQQRIDFFSERYPPFSTTPVEDNGMSDCFTLDFSTNSNNSTYNGEAKSNPPPSSADLHDDSSCDEMFGINEDFLRVPIPDRRVSSPIPRRDDSKQSGSDSNCASNCCSTSPLPCDNGSTYRTTTTQNNSQSGEAGAASPSFSQTPPLNNRRGSVVSPLPTGGSQCAMQYRTNRDMGEVSFPPRVPILDSVVYHSLLASLESS